MLLYNAVVKSNQIYALVKSGKLAIGTDSPYHYLKKYNKKILQCLNYGLNVPKELFHVHSYFYDNERSVLTLYCKLESADCAITIRRNSRWEFEIASENPRVLIFKRRINRLLNTQYDLTIDTNLERILEKFWNNDTACLKQFV